MANVAINQLNVIGFELFHDSENFLDELTSQEIASVEGGFGFFSFGGFGGHSGGHSGSYGGGYSGGYGGGYSGGYGGYGFGHKSWC